MAQWDTPSPTLLPLILRYSSAFLFCAFSPALSRHPKTKI